MIDVTNLSMDSIQAMLDNASDPITALATTTYNVVGTVVKETEKAVFVEGYFTLPKRGNWTGSCDSSQWIPKSQIKETAETECETIFILTNWFAGQLANKVKASI